MKKMIFFLVAIFMAYFLVPGVAKAQYQSDQDQQTGREESPAGGAYSITGLPLEFSGTIRRPFNVGFGVQLSNGTAKHFFTGVADIGINFRGKQFAGIRAMYHPVNWFAVGLSEYITFGQNMAIGQGFPTGDLFGFSFLSKNTVSLEAEFSLTIPLKQDVPYRHKFSLRIVPFGVFHERYGKGNWGIPRQNYDVGLSYTWAIPLK